MLEVLRHLALAVVSRGADRGPRLALVLLIPVPTGSGYLLGLLRDAEVLRGELIVQLLHGLLLRMRLRHHGLLVQRRLVLLLLLLVVLVVVQPATGTHGAPVTTGARLLRLAVLRLLRLAAVHVPTARMHRGWVRGPRQLLGHAVAAACHGSG